MTEYGTNETTTTEHYVFDGQNMVLTLDDSGNVTERVLYGPLVDQVLADEQISGGQTSDEILWTLGDNQETIRDLAVYNTATQKTTIATHQVFSLRANDQPDRSFGW